MYLVISNPKRQRFWSSLTSLSWPRACRHLFAGPPPAPPEIGRVSGGPPHGSHRSRSQPFQLQADGGHQRGDEFLVESEACTCRREQFRQWARAAQREGTAVVGDGPGTVGQASMPELQGAELRRCRIQCSRTGRGKCGTGDARNGRALPRIPTSPRSPPNRSISDRHAARRSSRVWPGWV